MPSAQEYQTKGIPYYEYVSWQNGDRSGAGIPPEAFTNYGEPAPTSGGAGAPNPNAPSAPGAPAPGGPQESGKEILRAGLRQMGLEELTDWAWSEKQAGVDESVIFGLHIYEQPKFKERFPYMEELRKKGRAISVEAALEMERSFDQVARANGIDAKYYDRNALIAGEASVVEFQHRIELAAHEVYKTDAVEREEVKRLYGVGDGDLIAFWMDPKVALPVLEQRQIAAQSSAAAVRSGFGQLNRDEAEQLGALGISAADASQGFGQLAASRELFTALPGDSDEGDVSREEQLGATFAGNAAAQERIRRRALKRRAAFEGGGGFALGQRGVAGLSSANR